MKNLTTKLGIVAVMLLTTALLWAQSPHKMSYQSVVRDAAFVLVKNTAVGMKVSILQGSATGTVVYAETHTPTTNINGLVSVEIGGGTVVTGTFNTINWANGPFFVKTETDPTGGTNYTITGTSQLLSVPFSLYSLNSGSSTPGPQGPAGPAGPTGPQGPQGPAGVLSVNCLQCHNHDQNATGYAGSKAEKRKLASDQYPMSVHATGEAHIAEGTNAGCAACHSDQAFNARAAVKQQPTYTGTGPYTFSFSVPASASSAMNNLPNKIGCFTCHKSNPADSMGFTWTDTVRLAIRSFPGRVKNFYFAGDNGKTNLCFSCHQARPYNQNTTSGNGSAMDFDAMKAAPNDTMYANYKTASTGNKYSFSRTFVGHYGWVGNVLAGVGYGGIELSGPQAYANSFHAGNTGCVDCHMAPPTVVSDVPSGGHTFSAEGNYRGCNTTDCHGSTPLSATATKVTTARNAQKANIDTLGELLVSQGKYLMATDTTLNMEGQYNNKWYKWSTKHYDGYLNINTTAGSFQVTNGTPAAGLYKWPSLTNGQFAALQAMTVALRESSGGIHNTKYVNALLRNAIAYMRANPIQ